MRRLMLILCLALTPAVLVPAVAGGRPEACAAACASGASVTFDAATIRRLPAGATATLCMRHRCRKFAARGSGVGISDSRAAPAPEGARAVCRADRPGESDLSREPARAAAADPRGWGAVRADLLDRAVRVQGRPPPGAGSHLVASRSRPPPAARSGARSPGPRRSGRSTSRTAGAAPARPRRPPRPPAHDPPERSAGDPHADVRLFEQIADPVRAVPAARQHVREPPSSANQISISRGSPLTRPVVVR